MRQCPQCRSDREACSDADKVWHRWRDVCHKTVAFEAAKRLHDAEYESAPWHDGTFTKWAKEYSAETPNHFLDGVTLWVAETPQHPDPPDPD